MLQEEKGEFSKIPIDIRTLVKFVITEHANQCPVRSRVERLEIKFGTLMGYMIGSGLIGGLGGSIISKLIGV